MVLGYASDMYQAEAFRMIVAWDNEVAGRKCVQSILLVMVIGTSSDVFGISGCEVGKGSPTPHL